MKIITFKTFLKWKKWKVNKKLMIGFRYNLTQIINDTLSFKEFLWKNNWLILCC